jgi:hypothetical protein
MEQSARHRQPARCSAVSAAMNPEAIARDVVTRLVAHDSAAVALRSDDKMLTGLPALSPGMPSCPRCSPTPNAFVAGTGPSTPAEYSRRGPVEDKAIGDLGAWIASLPKSPASHLGDPGLVLRYGHGKHIGRAAIVQQTPLEKLRSSTTKNALTQN